MKVSARNLAFPDAVPVFNVVQRMYNVVYNVVYNVEHDVEHYVEHNNQKFCYRFSFCQSSGDAVVEYLYSLCTT